MFDVLHAQAHLSCTAESGEEERSHSAGRNGEHLGSRADDHVDEIRRRALRRCREAHCRYRSITCSSGVAY
jgi:hypothetical protein